MRTTDGKDLEISDFRGKYLLIDFFHPMDVSIATLKQIYAAYTPGDQLAMLTINPPGKMNDIPWHQASTVMQAQFSRSILNTNFDLQNSAGAWLIGPDG